MNKESMGDDRDGELFLAKMRKAITPKAMAALFDDPTTEASFFRGAAQYLVSVANLNHRKEGHAAPASEDCEECSEEHEAATVFIVEAERRERTSDGQRRY